MRSFKDSVSGDDEDDKQLSKSEAKTEPARAEKAESRPAGGQSS
jgi:hypothetical protein